MRLAIAAAKANPFWPFGGVVIGAADRAVLAQGVNNGEANPILHGEIVAINDYVGTVKLRRFGQNTRARGLSSCRVGRAAPLRRRF